MKRTLETLRADAAAGVDGISPRVLKLRDLTSIIVDLLNSHCCLGGDPSAVAPLHLRSTALDNQRGIAIGCAAAKLLNAALLNRLLQRLDPILLGAQSGFRPGRSAVEQICTLRAVIDGCKTRQRTVSIVFVDFRKAFDSVSRSAIAKVLQLYGVPPQLVNAIMDLYCDTTAFVQTSHGPTEQFRTSSGVLQGDTLAPVLFIVVVDYVLRRCLHESKSFLLRSRRSARHPAIPLPALAYADDIALLCRDPDSAQHALTRLCEEAARVGLLINAKKTEVLHVGCQTPTDLILPGGEPVTQCHEFKYLGSQVISPEAIITSRRAQAWRASHLLRKIFNSSARDDSKVRLISAAVEPILLYGLEAIPITATREKDVDALYSALLRNALGVHYPTLISSRDLMSRVGVPPLSITLRRRRQRLLGHCLRSHNRDNAIPLAMAILHPPSERLRRGQAHTQTLLQTFLQDLAHLHLTPQTTLSCPSSLFSQRVRAN